MHNGILPAMMTDDQRKAAVEAFEEAIKKAGDQTALGMVLGCSQSRVSRIRSGESVIEGEMAVRIDKQFKVPKWRLRPDLFDAPASAKRKPAAKRASKKKAA